MRMVRELSRRLAQGDDIMPSLYQLESVHSDVIYLKLCGMQLPIRATELIAEALSTIDDYCEITRSTIEVANRTTTCPGRPRFDLSRRQLDHLMELGFTAVDMASILGVSRSTVHRRFQEFGMSMGRKYFIISNEHLDNIVRSITHLYPDCGQKMMQGHLKERGIVVQQTRLRESMRRVDPFGTEMRFRLNLRRRQYNVAFPNELWHLDGNHKLIRLFVLSYTIHINYCLNTKY